MMSSSKARRSVPPPPGSAAHKTSVYSRFIPREELSSFAAWAPGILSDDDNTYGTGVESGPASAETDSEQVAEKLRQARQNGYQDGYRDGLVALEGFKRSFAAQATQQLGALVGSVGGQLDALQQEMAEALAATALSLARQIVRTELAHRPEAVAIVAAEAVEALRQGGVREPERIAAMLDAAAYGLYRKGKGDLLDGIATVVAGVLRRV